MTTGQILEAFRRADQVIAEHIELGTVDRATALVVFLTLRDSLRRFDPGLAEQLVARETETAVQGIKEPSGLSQAIEETSGFFLQGGERGLGC